MFDVQARLAALGDPKPTHCPISDARVAVQATLRRRTAILDGLKDYEALLADPAGHPWRGVRESGRSLTLVDEVRRHLHQIAAGLPSFREIVDALESAGWQRAPSSMAHWLMQTRRVVQAASYPLIPLAWFAGDPREIATAYVQLDEATKSYRTARTTAAEFSEEKVLRAAPALFDALQRLRTSPRQVAPFQSKSLRKMCDFLQPLLERLKELLARLAAAQSSFEDFCQVVRVAPRQVPVREWEQYKAIQGLLDERVRPCREWFESAGRKELRRDADQCRELNRQAAEARDFLSERLSSKAFAPETAALAVEAAKYTSFWRRWLPSWRRVREQLTGLYRVAVPELSILLADIARLRDYHRHKGSARRVSDERAADVALDELGAPDWERTIAPLAVVESLDTVWATFPDLQAAFATNAFDRRLAAAALATFEQHHAAFTSAVAALGPSFGLPHVFQSEHPRGRSTAAMLTAALNEERVVWEGVLQAAVSLRSLLQDGGDLAVSTLETKLASLDALRSSAAKIRSIAGLLPLSESDRVGVRDRDWSSERKAGEWLVRFLHEHANQPPQELLDAVRRPDARAKLSAVAARVADLEERGFFTAWDGLMRLFGDERTSLGGRIADASLEALGEWLAARQSDVPRILEWTGLNELRRQAAEGGVDAVVVGAMEKQFAANEATSVYLAKFFRAWLDHVQSQTPELNGLGTETPDRIVAQFRELDRDAIDLASGRVRATLLNAPDRPRTSVGAPRGSELGILLGEVGKKQRHMPLRKLFAGTPTLLPRLKPCLMMSPLAVSTYLSAGDFKFDLVVIDEASQVRPHDAVAAVYRGKQLVVAGDQKQLPPTSFFERASTVDDDEDAEPEDQMADFESILDVCTTLGVPRRRLRWHYRSRREPLIAFSNRHIYDAELVTFPSVEDGGDPPAVRFEYVADGRWKSGSGNAFNPIEARRTAELVVEHFRRSPDQTLGVIAFSRRQQIGITDELERLRRKDGSLEQFFSDERDEPFFVKNLENVQGDERDAIFLSIGYGPDDHGRIAMRFGPLNLKGGERRLNVAVTRARESMTVVSSLKAQDIDLSRTDAVGAKLLRAYLDFAERGVEAFGTETTAGDEHAADSPFEVEVARALTQRGLIVRRQVGCSSYRIDLAVVDPDRPGRFLLGVECDGATYHSSKTARDRDRIRQEILESLGWSMLRIWSTDWIRNPASQVERVLAAVEQAKRTPPQFRKATPQVVATVVKPAVARAVARPKPTAADAASKTAAQCKSIDDVREHVLEKVVLERLGLYGTTQPDELIQAVSRELGFQRTGPRIKARVEATIEQLVTSGRLVRVEGGVRKSSS
ncbi:MAG TPA: AAA domain-containing protein [Pirellulales bacterium]